MKASLFSKKEKLAHSFTEKIFQKWQLSLEIFQCMKIWSTTDYNIPIHLFILFSMAMDLMTPSQKFLMKRASNFCTIWRLLLVMIICKRCLEVILRSTQNSPSCTKLFRENLNYMLQETSSISRQNKY